MGRRIFISFLGTTNYIQTHYNINGKKGKPVRFIQEALADYYCYDWTNNDKILIFYTEESKKRNWEDNGQNNINDEIDKLGLKTVLSTKSYSSIVEGCEITDGFSEDDIWSVFDIIYSKIQDKDEIYLDVTHAFRSIPLFSIVLLNFSQFLKNSTLKSVHYGAFEKLGSPFLVKNIPLEDRVAPVIDLTHLIKLQNLTLISNDFIKYGKVGSIGSIFNINDFPKNLQNTIIALRNLVDKLEGFILTNRVSEIKEAKFARDVKDQITSLVKSSKLKKAEKEILERLLNMVKVFSPNSENNILEAINWALRYNMIPQAYTIGQEYLITLVVQKFIDKNFYNDEKPKEREKNYRVYIAAILGIDERNIQEGKISGELIKNEALTKELLENELIKSIRRFYKTIADNRNIVNHAKKSDKTPVQLKEQFNKNFFECINNLKNNGEKFNFSNTEKIFINFSNHHSSLWCKEQLDAACSFGNIIDIKFPEIDENGDEYYISSIVDNYFESITAMCKNMDATIHIMGEMNFTYSLIKKLQETGIRCVASTSKRMVNEETPGRKGEVIFKFERFRIYE